jgi:hypothetical protein
MEWPVVVLILGVMVITVGTWGESRRRKIGVEQDDAMRQLVRRYEQLAENTLDAQQRVAADVSELRSRTTSIEQILRSVE